MNVRRYAVRKYEKYSLNFSVFCSPIFPIRKLTFISPFPSNHLAKSSRLTRNDDKPTFWYYDENDATNTEQTIVWLEAEISLRQAKKVQ